MFMLRIFQDVAIGRDLLSLYECWTTSIGGFTALLHQELHYTRRLEVSISDIAAASKGSAPALMSGRHAVRADT